MKATSKKAIDIVLLVLAILAVLAAGAMAALFYTYPAGEMEGNITALNEKTAQAKDAAAAIRAELQDEETAAKADLRALGEEGEALQTRLENLAADKAKAEEKLAALEEEVDLAENIYDRMLEMRVEYGNKIRELEDLINAGKTDVKICYWTLDDGPTYFTREFLEAAEELDVGLTFFTAHDANESQDEPGELRLEMMGGHSVCNHTYSHQYNGNVYSSLDSFVEQVKKQDEFVFESTGIHTEIFRFPGGSAWARSLKDDAIAALDDMGMKWIDWSCNAYDAGAADTLPDASAESHNIVSQVKTMDIAMILSHDWNYNTLGAMKKAVPQLKELGYIFLPLLPQSWTFGNTEIVFK